jgi:hypothetical protein
MVRHRDAFREAARERDLEAMFVNNLRLMELNGELGSPRYQTYFMSAARLLNRMGHEEAADAAIEQAVDLYSKDPSGSGRRVALEMSVAYALDCNKPHKALAAAEELLAGDPQNVLALSVKMLVSLRERNMAEARACARRVRSLAEKGTSAYSAASQILATDPNESMQNVEAAESK